MFDSHDQEIIHSQSKYTHKLPEALIELSEMRMSEDILERYISLYSPYDGVVFDPFLGCGTTVSTAEKLDRQGYGVEIIKELAQFALSTVSNKESVTIGDVRQFDYSLIPPIDLCITSPPFMNKTDPEDPLNGYTGKVSSYEDYLDQLADIFVEGSRHLAPSGRIAIQIQNLVNEEGATPLAFDLHARLEKRLSFLGNDLILWGQPVYGYPWGYMLFYE